MSLALLDKDGDGDIDSEEWAAGYKQLGKSAPGVPNPAVWYGTLPDGPAFRIEQTSMNKMYSCPSQMVEKRDFRDEVKGVMVGYSGHVPRARDKVGGSPLGHLPGTPVSPNGKVGIDMESGIRTLPEDRAKYFAQMDTQEDYTSEARDKGSGGAVKPKLYNEGIIPGYGGHKQAAKFSFGSTIYTNGIPKGGGKHDNWSGKNFASTGHGASSLANFEDDVRTSFELVARARAQKEYSVRHSALLTGRLVSRPHAGRTKHVGRCACDVEWHHLGTRAGI
jgi:hypothetical protein